MKKVVENTLIKNEGPLLSITGETSTTYINLNRLKDYYTVSTGDKHTKIIFSVYRKTDNKLTEVPITFFNEIINDIFNAITEVIDSYMKECGHELEEVR